eukprot:9127856-Pyramimonas_sp.AAC.1
MRSEGYTPNASILLVFEGKRTLRGRAFRATFFVTDHVSVSYSIRRRRSRMRKKANPVAHTPSGTPVSVDAGADSVPKILAAFPPARYLSVITGTTRLSPSDYVEPSPERKAALLGARRPSRALLKRPLR